MKGRRSIQLRSNVVSNDLANKGGRSISPDLPYYELLFSLAWDARGHYFNCDSLVMLIWFFVMPL